MNLFLLRHGPAVELGAKGFLNDADRPLTTKGKTKVREVAAALKALELSFDLILTSPHIRALQTAQVVARGLGARRNLEVFDALAPGGSRRALLDLLGGLKPQPENVLLVGHEPGLSDLVSVLVAGQTGFPVTMKKAGLCKLSLRSPAHLPCATLEWLLTPGQMSLMK